jgi:predicted PurR-regulated permease PerM
MLMASYFRMLMVWAALSFSVYAFWKWYSGLLLPFVGAFILSVWLEPYVVRLQRWGFSRSLAALIALASWVAVIFLTFILLLTVMFTELSQLAHRLPSILPPLERSGQQLAAGRWSQQA